MGCDVVIGSTPAKDRHGAKVKDPSPVLTGASHPPPQPWNRRGFKGFSVKHYLSITASSERRHISVYPDTTGVNMKFYQGDDGLSGCVSINPDDAAARELVSQINAAIGARGSK